MYPLFGNANKARWVDRDGKSMPFVDRAGLAALAAQHVGDRANPLASFATGPLAVLVGANTASAGEMLLMALMAAGLIGYRFYHSRDRSYRRRLRKEQRNYEARQLPPRP